MNIERKISRREFLIGAGFAIIAAGCKRAEEKLSVVAMEPSIIPEPTQLPTERPTDVPTPKPTETLQPTAVPTPEATPTPEPKRTSTTTIESNLLLELAKAPEIEGLKAFLENEKIVYRAKAGNPYKLEAGNYAGEVVHYVINQKSESGLGLNPLVLEVLLRNYQYPTFEYIEGKGEKIPLPFDPRGLEFGVGEIKYAREVTGPDGKKFEMRICFLGLDLPVGTTICCPIGINLKGIGMVSWYGRSGRIFSSKEREEALSQKCLDEGFCTIKEYVSKGKLVKVVHERPRALEIQPEDKRTLPFSIIFPWDSQVAGDIFAKIDEDPDKEGGGPKKQVSLGDPLFVLDSNKPAVQFAFPSDYPIVLAGRQAVTDLDSLFKIDGRYVFILPSS